MASGAKENFSIIVGELPVVVRTSPVAVNPATVFSWEVAEQSGVPAADDSQDDEILSLMEMGYKPLDGASRELQTYLQSWDKPEKVLAVEEYMQSGLHQTQGMFTPNVRGAARDTRQYAHNQLVEVHLRGGELLLGGVKVSISDEQAIKMVEYKYRIQNEERVDEVNVLKEELAAYETSCRSDLDIAIRLTEAMLRWEAGTEGKIVARNWSRADAHAEIMRDPDDAARSVWPITKHVVPSYGPVV
ncbi:hypothetical protein CYMTET_35826, partial [Cymbomonas tetramitiformis]